LQRIEEFGYICPTMEPRQFSEMVAGHPLRLAGSRELDVMPGVP
jgi:hypothetical protein